MVAKLGQEYWKQTRDQIKDHHSQTFLGSGVEDDNDKTLF